MYQSLANEMNPKFGIEFYDQVDVKTCLLVCDESICLDFEIIKLMKEDKMIENDPSGNFKLTCPNKIGNYDITAKEFNQFFSCFNAYIVSNRRITPACWVAIDCTVTKSFLLLGEYFGAKQFIECFDKKLSRFIHENDVDIKFDLQLFLWLECEIKRNCGIPLTIKAIKQSTKYFKQMQEMMKIATNTSPMDMMQLFQSFHSEESSGEDPLYIDVIPFTANQIQSYLAFSDILQAEEYLESLVDTWNQVNVVKGQPHVKILDFDQLMKSTFKCEKQGISNRIVVKGFAKYQYYYHCDTTALGFHLIMLLRDRLKSDHPFAPATMNEDKGTWIGVYYRKLGENNNNQDPITTQQKSTQSSSKPNCVIC